MKNKWLDLFLTFAKIGAFTFGGGYAMIPLIEKEVIENKKWINEEEMIDIVAISQSTPGVLSVNCATFTGYKVAGVFGSFMATLGVVIPSFIIIILVSIAFNQFKDNNIVAAVFKGIQAGVVVLILGAAIKLSKPLDKNLFSITLVIVSFLVTVLTSFNVIYVLFICGVLGLIYKNLDFIKGGDK